MMESLESSLLLFQNAQSLGRKFFLFLFIIHVLPSVYRPIGLIGPNLTSHSYIRNKMRAAGRAICGGSKRNLKESRVGRVRIQVVYLAGVK